MRSPTQTSALLNEVRARSTWQVVVAYLGVSWGGLEALDLFSERYELPGWLFTTALVLLGLGLAALLAAAFTGTSPEGSEAVSSEGTPPLKVTAGSAVRSSWRTGGLVLLVALATWGLVATGWLVVSRGRPASALTAVEVVAQLERFSTAAAWDSAYALAKDVQEELAEDQIFQDAFPLYASRIDILSAPTGAEVYRRWYGADQSEWEFLGITPIRELAFPRGVSLLRFEKDGYQSLELGNGAAEFGGVEFRLAEVGSDVEDMVWVPGGETRLRSPGLNGLEPITIGSYWIDRYEVTNRQYKVFVDAGGYRDRGYWHEHIATADGTVPWDEAVTSFTDRTGRQGPSTWVGGAYPAGTEDHPVTGVSWYEAAAYARFAGKELPTVYHWNRAAETRRAALIVPRSNINGTTPLPVGVSSAVSGYGAADMAGNAREWCLNAAGDRRYILGGGWNDSDYLFVDAYSQPAWDRTETNGFRLASYGDGEDLTLAARELERPARDFLAEPPISDEVFEAYLSMYGYDDLPLNDAVESRDTTDERAVREVVTFDAAYGGERMQAVIFTPRSVEPPYQTAVFFPGSGALFQESTDAVGLNRYWDFITESGRAWVVPIYMGTYGRGGGATLSSDTPQETSAYRDVVIQWGKDLRRTLDYLETRSDIDSERFAYVGSSWGGAMGGLMLALEPRFKAAVLRVAGLELPRAMPEVSPSNFLPRITMPVLMLNGRTDHFFPYETSQVPMYQLLGTPAEDKVQRVYPGGHTVPYVEMVGETLDWLDKYLGPVR